MGRRDKRRKVENCNGIASRIPSAPERSSVQSAIEEGLRQQRSKANEMQITPTAVIEAHTSQSASDLPVLPNLSDQLQGPRKDFVHLLFLRQMNHQRRFDRWTTTVASFRLLSESELHLRSFGRKYEHATLHPLYGVLFSGFNSLNLCGVDHNSAARMLRRNCSDTLDLCWASAAAPTFLVLRNRATIPLLAQFFLNFDGSLSGIATEGPVVCDNLTALAGFTEDFGYVYGEYQLQSIKFSLDGSHSMAFIFNEREGRIRTVAADPKEHDYIAIGLRNGQILFASDPQNQQSSFHCLGSLPYCIDHCHWLQKSCAPQLLVRDVCGNVQLFDVRRAKHPVSIVKEGRENTCRKVGFWVSHDERLVVTQDEINGANAIQNAIGVYPILPHAGVAIGDEKMANPFKKLSSVDMDTEGGTLANWDISFPRTVNVSLEDITSGLLGRNCYVVLTNRANQVQRLISFGS